MKKIALFLLTFLPFLAFAQSNGTQTFAAYVGSLTKQTPGNNDLIPYATVTNTGGYAAYSVTPAMLQAAYVDSLLSSNNAWTGTNNFTGGFQISGQAPFTTINGTNCLLMQSCTITLASSLIINSTPISGGAANNVLTDNGGALTETATSGTGNIARVTSPVFITPALGTPSAVTLTNGTGLPTSGLTGSISAAQMLALASGDVYQGNGSNLPAAVTLSAAIDAALGSTQGDILYRGASTWTVLAPGTATNCLQTGGAAANPSWGSCGSAAVSSVSNSDSTLTVTPTTGAVVASLNLSHANTWAAAQTFTNSDLLIKGSSTGVNTFTAANAGASNFTTTVPANTGTLAELNLAETWTAPQTFTNSDFVLLGSSTGGTTLTSANAGASNFTATLPAATDTIVELAQTQTLTNKSIAGSEINSGLVGSSVGGTGVNNGSATLTMGGAITFSGAFTQSFTATANTAVTLPTTGTLAALSVAQTWSAVQSFNDGDFLLKGSSSGGMTLHAPAASATDSITFPAVASDTVAVLGLADQTQAGGVNLTAFSIGTVSSGTSTIDCGKNPGQYLTNGGAFTLAAPASDGVCYVLIINNASAGAVSFSGFTAEASHGDALTTTNTSKFTVSIWRINGTADYRVVAMQ